MSRRDEFVEIFHGAPIARIYGMRLHYADDGSAIFDLKYNPNFDHAAGGIHGGVMATMLDNAGWFTVAPHFENWISTVEFRTQLLDHVEKEDLRAQGRIVRLGKTLTVAAMDVHTKSGRHIATGLGTFAVSKIPFGLKK
ncbi:MAG TPA: PaaI family thioesterase [Bdellovibrionota bacterium]|nr:PaaI family thioesterase [Bdellovibrionota bacterium]